MDSKLTLKLDKEVIDKAKAYAVSQQRSLSRLIESYLKSLVQSENQSLKSKDDITPFVKSMITGVNIPTDLEVKELYRKHLEEKHK